MLLPWAWRENDRIRRQASALLVDAAIEGRVARFIQGPEAPRRLGLVTEVPDGSRGWPALVAELREPRPSAA